MRKLMITAGLAAATAFATATPTLAQGIAIDTPIGGVRVGEPYRHHHYRDYDGPRVYNRGYRERDVYLRGGSDCRTVTIQRDDGSMKRIRRCD